MKLIDKLLLGLLCVLTVCFGIVLISAAIGFPLTDAVLQSAVTSLQSPLVSLCLCVAALALIAISIRLLVAAFGKEARGSNNILVYQNETGTSYMTVSAINSMVYRFLQSDENVHGARTAVKVHNGGATITARISANPNVSIPEMTEHLQNRIKSHIETYSGAKVDRVQVIIESTEESAAPGRVA